MKFDVIVVGAGIVGLAHAYEARRRGLSVAVVERDHRAVGASVRNFGFVTVTGQRAGDTWRRARRSRDVWTEIAEQAGIRIEHRGLWVLAHRPAAAEVLHAFARTEMGEACQLYSVTEAGAQMPSLRTEHATAALYSPHELRVESREAIPRLTHWLQQEHELACFFGETVLGVQDGEVHTAQRTLQADRVVICPGTELTGVAGPWLRDYGLQLTRLQMLRVQPEAGFRLNAAVMSDLSLVRYAGYAALPESAVLLQQLSVERAHSLAHGIHLIAVQSADGSLVVGDSHHAADSPLPFASEAVDDLILQQLYETLDLGQCRVVERWGGVYPVGHHEDCLVVRPSPSQRVVVVTSGTGASTAFGIAEDVFNQW